MNNFKVMMNGIIKENPTFGYYFIGYQRHGYGTGHHVRADLLERGDLTD